MNEQAFTGTGFIRRILRKWTGKKYFYNVSAVGVTETGILPNHSFVYKFQIIDQHGTYWYHSHYSLQYARGMFGSFIVEPLEEEEHLPEYTLMLSDNYHQNVNDLDKQYLQPGGNGNEPLPDSALINGIGQNSGHYFNSSTLLKFTSISVQHGKRYRLRIINTSAFSPIRFGRINFDFRH